MAIKATLLDTAQEDYHSNMIVEFNDTTTSKAWTESYHYSGDDIKGFIIFLRNLVNQRNRTKGVDFSQYVGKEIDLSPEVIAPPVPPTANEVAKAEWFSDWSKLKEVKKLLELAPNISTASRLQVVADLQSSVENDFLDSYFGDL